MFHDEYVTNRDQTKTLNFHSSLRVFLEVVKHVGLPETRKPELWTTHICESGSWSTPVMCSFTSSYQVHDSKRCSYGPKMKICHWKWIFLERNVKKILFWENPFLNSSCKFLFRFPQDQSGVTWNTVQTFHMFWKKTRIKIPSRFRILQSQNVNELISYLQYGSPLPKEWNVSRCGWNYSVPNGDIERRL